MSARTRSVGRAVLAAGLAVSLSALTWSSAAAQEGDLCGVLTPEDLSAVLPGSYSTQGGFEGTCSWGGSTEDGTGVLVIGYLAPGSAGDMPGGEIVDIDGRPAFSMRDPSNPVPTHVVGVETANGLVVLTVSVEDESIDVAALTTALAATAVERFESGAGPAVTATDPGAAPPTTGPGATAPTITAGEGLCDRATPEEVAAAAGLEVTLSLTELDGTCSYDALTADGYVLIYVAPQDPTTFDAMITALGGEEIDGPGETDWWASSLASLFSRTGDEVLQVSYASSAVPSDDELRATAIAIMSAFLAP